MPDNKRLRDGRDHSKVDSKDESEVEQVHSNFPSLAHAQIVAAIRAAGPLRKNIYAYIRKKHRL